MTIKNDKSFVLEDPSGVRWHLYLSEQHNIVYSHLKEDKSWGPPSTLDTQPTEGFEATMDPQGMVHILAYTLSRRLIYYRWDGSQWWRQTVEQIRSRFQNISYFTIFASQDLVHILYFIANSLKRSSETLIHYTGKGDKWEGGKLWGFASDDKTTPLSTFIDSWEIIHLLYSKQSNNEHILLYSCFDPSSLSWSVPIAVYRSMCAYEDCYLYVDNHQNVHTLWKEKEDNENFIKYLLIGEVNKSMEPPQHTSVLYKGHAEPKYPCFLFLENLYCTWKMEDNTYYMSSPDMGITWGKPQILTRASDETMVFYQFTSFNSPHLPPTLKLWGIDYSGDPHFIATHSTQVETTKKKKTNEMQQYQELKDRIIKIERHLDNINSTMYAFEEQLHQKDKSMFFINSMIKKLNFQVEQLHIRNYKNIHQQEEPQSETEADRTHHEDMQCKYIQHENTQWEGTEYEVMQHEDVQHENVQHEDVQSEGVQHEDISHSIQPGDDQPHAPQPQTHKHEPTTAQHSPGSTERISLGNVDILINPEDDDI
jgi:hypothetical protein